MRRIVPADAEVGECALAVGVDDELVTLPSRTLNGVAPASSFGRAQLH
jgi:hypothetical protein